jgi:TolB-like protein
MIHLEAGMRRMRAVVLALVLIVLAVPGRGFAQEDRRPGIAIFPFEDGGWVGMVAEDRRALGVGLQQLLLTQLSQNTNLRIVERNALRPILEEQDSGRTRMDPQTAARIGRIVGARYVILASFSDYAGSNRPGVTGRIVDVETSEVRPNARNLRGNRDELFELVVELSRQLTADLQLPPLPEAQRQQEDTRAPQVPDEAITLFSRAQVFEDVGRSAQAEQLYEQIIERFPQMTEASTALRKLRGG